MNNKIATDTGTARLSLIPNGNASNIVTGSTTKSESHPIPGNKICTIPIEIRKNVAEPAKDLSKNLSEYVILPTIAANESAIVRINRAATAIFFSNKIMIMVAEMNK